MVQREQVQKPTAPLRNGDQTPLAPLKAQLDLDDTIILNKSSADATLLMVLLLPAFLRLRLASFVEYKSVFLLVDTNNRQPVQVLKCNTELRLEKET